MVGPTFNVFAELCPSRQVFDAIFSRWGILVLGALAERPARFGELRKSIQGISEKMLSQTLKVLERERLVDRSSNEGRSLFAEYALTAAGRKIAAGVTTVIADLYDALQTRNEAPHSSPKRVRARRLP